jgi:hypothetical protein
MKCVFFLQTSNLHLNKQKYKSEKETFYLYYTKFKKKQKTHKNKKIKKIKV